jgi:hypothetical protein
MKMVTHRFSFSPESGGSVKPSRAREEIRKEGSTRLTPKIIINLIN